MLFLLTIGCENSNNIDVNLMKNENFKESLFKIGNNKYLTDSCSLYFACDCCSGELIFNSDSSFYYIDYCMSNQFIRKGTFSVYDGQVDLFYDEKCVYKQYNYENEIDSSAIDYFISDTIFNELKISYQISICDNNIVLSDFENKDIAIKDTAHYDIRLEVMNTY